MQSVNSAERSRAATRPQKKTWIWDSNYRVIITLINYHSPIQVSSNSFVYISTRVSRLRVSLQACVHVRLCVHMCVHMGVCVRACVCCPLLYVFIQTQPLWSERTDIGLCQICSAVLIQADAEHLDLVITHRYVSTPSLIGSQIHISWNHLQYPNNESLALLLSGMIQADFGHLDRILLFFQSFDTFLFLVI